MITNYISNLLKIITDIVLLICVTGTAITILKCWKKYRTSSKQLLQYKSALIKPSDLKNLTKSEYKLWLYNFLCSYDYIDFENNISNFSFEDDSKDYIIGLKQEIPVFIKIYPWKKSNFCLSDCNQFIGEMLFNNCSVGILVTDALQTDETKLFISECSEQYKLNHLTNNHICNLHNSSEDFPTIIA